MGVNMKGTKTIAEMKSSKPKSENIPPIKTADDKKTAAPKTPLINNIGKKILFKVLNQCEFVMANNKKQISMFKKFRLKNLQY